MFKRIVAAGLVAGALLILPVLPADAGGHMVKATQQKKFSPAKITVNKGDSVTWKDTASFKHTVTATSSNWTKNVKLKPGQSTSFHFTKNGTYTYICTIHAGMSGKVIVK